MPTRRLASFTTVAMSATGSEDVFVANSACAGAIQIDALEDVAA